MHKGRIGAGFVEELSEQMFYNVDSASENTTAHLILISAAEDEWDLQFWKLH